MTDLNSFPKLPIFMEDMETELQSHGQITSDNIKAVQNHQKKKLQDSATLINNFENQTTFLHTQLSSRKQNNIAKQRESKHLNQIYAILNDTKTTENNVKDLENILTQCSSELSSIKKEHEKQTKVNFKRLIALKKALHYFTTYFQYSIKLGNEKGNAYSVILNFMNNGKPSTHRVKFIFNRETDLLSDIHCDVLSANDKFILIDEYMKNRNILKLLTFLRNTVFTAIGC